MRDEPALPPELPSTKALYDLLADEASDDRVLAWLRADPRLEEAFQDIEADTRAALGPDADVYELKTLREVAGLRAMLMKLAKAQWKNHPREITEQWQRAWYLEALRFLRSYVHHASEAEAAQLTELRARVVHALLEDRRKKRELRASFIRKIPPTPDTLTRLDIYRLIHEENVHIERPFSWLKADARLAETFQEIEQEVKFIYPDGLDDLQFYESVGYYVLSMQELLDNPEWHHPREVHSSFERSEYLLVLRLLRFRLRRTNGGERKRLTNLRERMLRALAKDRRHPYQVRIEQKRSLQGRA